MVSNGCAWFQTISRLKLLEIFLSESLVLARASGQGIQLGKLSVRSLLRMQLDHERERNWKTLKDSRDRTRDENLLAYATIVGGIDLKDYEGIKGSDKYFPSLDDYDPDRMKSMTGELCTD